MEWRDKGRHKLFLEGFWRQKVFGQRSTKAHGLYVKPWPWPSPSPTEGFKAVCRGAVSWNTVRPHRLKFRWKPERSVPWVRWRSRRPDQCSVFAMEISCWDTPLKKNWNVPSHYFDLCLAMPRYKCVVHFTGTVKTNGFARQPGCWLYLSSHGKRSGSRHKSQQTVPRRAVPDREKKTRKGWRACSFIMGEKILKKLEAFFFLYIEKAINKKHRDVSIAAVKISGGALPDLRAPNWWFIADFTICLLPTKTQGQCVISLWWCFYCLFAITIHSF